MKKIIIFLICFILVASSAQAKEIILSNCSETDEKFTKGEITRVNLIIKNGKKMKL